MQFFRQLRVLLWKYAVLAKRRPFRKVMEILLPVLTVWILIIGRLLTTKSSVGGCYHTPKPLISHGYLNVVGSVFCDFANECRPEEHAKDLGQPWMDPFNLSIDNLPRSLSSTINYFCGSTLSNSTNETSETPQTNNNNNNNNYSPQYSRQILNYFHILTTIEQTDIGQFCTVFRSFTNLIPYRFVPLLKIIGGKLLYYPDNEVVRAFLTPLTAQLGHFQNLSDALLLLEEQGVTDPENIHLICDMFNPIFKPTCLQYLESLDPETVTVTITAVRLLVHCIPYDRIEGFNSSSDMLAAARSLADYRVLWAAIDFTNIPEKIPTAEQLSEEYFSSIIQFKIRMDSVDIDSTEDYKVFDKERHLGSRTDFRYYLRGFVMLQEVISRGIIENYVGESLRDRATMLQQTPYPCYEDDPFFGLLSNMLGLSLTFGWLFALLFAVLAIVEEKEIGLKEMLYILGVSNVVDWVAWIIATLIVMIISMILTIFFVYIFKVFAYTSISLFAVVLLSYLLCLMSQAALISVFFSNTNMATISSIFIYIALEVPALYLHVNNFDIPSGGLTAFCLLPQIALEIICYYIASWESVAIGLQWSNVLGSPFLNDKFFPFIPLVMLWLDTFLNWMATYYLGKVIPRKYGVTKPWYFPCSSLKSYIYKKKHAYASNTSIAVDDDDDDDAAAVANANIEGMESKNHIEPVALSEDVTVGVSIRKLSKIFPGSDLPAVDSLSLDFFRGQITSFLGHNGAGKTTTISILTGIISPSSGTAIIEGMDIRYDIDLIRQRLGYCPQHNVLYPCLSVMEHVYLFGALKGLSKKDLEVATKEVMTSLELTDSLRIQSRNLSGGMKRRLSLALTFLGNVDTVFLDEPTAGVDPQSRKQIWNMLGEYKRDRTIVLTTHNMEEADVLGDRIAIISHGRLRCVGSSFYLKRQFGRGYTLLMTFVENADISARHDELIGFIKGYIPNAFMLQLELSTRIMAVILPYENDSEMFTALFSSLEGVLERFGIDSYGVTDTPLQDIFFAMTDDDTTSTITTTTSTTTATNSNENMNCSNISESVTEPSSVADELNADSSVVFKLKNNFFTKLKFYRKPHRLSSVSGGGGGRPTVKDITTISSTTTVAKDTEEKPVAEIYQQTVGRRTGCTLFLAQMMALFLKRFHTTRRSVRTWFMEFIGPVILVLLVGIWGRQQAISEAPPSLEIHPWWLKINNDTLYYFYGNRNLQQPQHAETADFERFLLANKTFCGNRCMDPSVYDLKDQFCTAPASFSDDSVLTEEILSGGTCNCLNSYRKCSKAYETYAPPRLRKATDDVLYNITAYDPTTWLLQTYGIYEEKRFGGLEFDFELPPPQTTSLLTSKSIPTAPNIKMDEVLEMLIVTEPLLSFYQALMVVLKDNEAISTARVWFDNKGYVSAAAYLNFYHNSLYRWSLQQKHGIQSNAARFGISVINHPLPYPTGSPSRNTYLLIAIDTYITLILLIAVSMIASSILIFPVMERVTLVKHLQFISGVNAFTYWMSTFLYDMMTFSIPFACFILVLYLFGIDAYTSPGTLGLFASSLFLYAVAAIPMQYPFTYILTSPSVTFASMFVFNFTTGFTAIFLIYALDFQPISGQFQEILEYLLIVFPQFNLGRSLLGISTVYYLSLFREVTEEERWLQYGKYRYATIVEDCFFLPLIILLEAGVLRKTWDCLVRALSSPCRSQVHCYETDEHTDDDVLHERNRVLFGVDSEPMILKVSNLTHFYKRRAKRPAIVDVAFGVKAGNCFGLLGANGAGKTTTFQILTSCIQPTFGEVELTDFSVAANTTTTAGETDGGGGGGAGRNFFGYCPQTNALMDELTATETLHLFGRLLGIREADVKLLTRQLITDLGLGPYANKSAHTYSGGNKRKLSVGIALIGFPCLVFLDEPSSGMDPGARRLLWRLLQHNLRHGQSIVLTSHNMEECETLCDKVTIMADGKMLRIGSPQKLISRFSDSNFVVMNFRSDAQMRSVEECKKQFMSEFPGSDVVDDSQNFLQFRVPTAVTLSTLFAYLGRLKAAERIHDFSVQQANLDHVFLHCVSESRKLGVVTENQL